MATTPYSPVTWGDNEPVFTKKLNKMAQNDQWLYENTPRMLYKAQGVARTQGVKIASGIATVHPDKDTFNRDTIYFGSFFTVGCRPIVVVSLINNGEAYIHLSTHGISGQFPDHRGFELHGHTDKRSGLNVFTRTYYVSWIAVGY